MNEVNEERKSVIGIDIDSDQTRDVVIRWIRAKMYFPKSAIRLFISPSGKGYHMRIYPNEPVDFWNGIMARALIGDDPWRIKYNLEKYALSEGRESWNDILFSNKNRGKEIEVEGLKWYEERYIIAEYDNEEERRKRTKEVAEKLHERLQKVKKEKNIEEYVLCVPFDDKLLPEMQELQEKIINQAGGEIKARIYENFSMDSDRLFVIYSQDDQKLREMSEEIMEKYGLVRSWIKILK